MESAQPKQQEESNVEEEGNKQAQMDEKMNLNGSEIATNDHSRSAVKEFVSTEEEEEEEEEHQQLKIHEQSQEGSKEEGDKQVQMSDIHGEKKNHDGAEIATNDHLVSAQDQEEEQQQQNNILEQSQEEKPKEVDVEVEGEIKKVGDRHGSNINVEDISIQREKKTLEGRTFSRDVQTQRYLDRLIRDNDTNLETGLMKGVGDFFDKFQRFPDEDFPTLKSFVTTWLGLVDVPATDLTNLMVLIGRMKPIIKAANKKKLNKKQNVGNASNEMIKIKGEEEEDDEEEEEDAFDMGF